MIIKLVIGNFIAIESVGIIFPLLIVFTVGTILFFKWYNSPGKKIMRSLKKSPAKPINSVRDGMLVRLHGVAKLAQEPLIAPLSGRKCVYYHIQVEQKGDKNSWRQILSEFKNQNFYLQVGNELALVKAQAKHRTLFHLVADHNLRSGWRNDATPTMEEFLNKHGKRSTSMLFNLNKTLRYKEAIIEPGEQIVVKGIGKWQALETPIAGFSYSRVLNIVSTQREKLIVTDDPKALKILHEK